MSVQHTVSSSAAHDSLVAKAPEPRFVMAPDDVRLATYDTGDEAAPTVLLVHGFASSASVNWYATGWVRELVRAGYRVIALDQRGHGRSDKPTQPTAYSMQHLVKDVETVLDTYLLDEVGLVGYSLGARVGWHAALSAEHRITRLVLGGIPDGRPLTRFRVDEALAQVHRGDQVQDRITRAYLDMAARTSTNDLAALIALVQGLQDGLQPDPATPPRQPALFATGSEDGILEASMRLAAVTPHGEFFEVPGRNHFNAPTARSFRDRALEFLGGAADSPRGSSRLAGRGRQVTTWDAGIAAVLFQGSGEVGATDLESARRLLADRWERWQECLALAAAASARAEVVG